MRPDATRMEIPPPDIEWFRSRLSLARAHIDLAIGANDGEADARANAASAAEICRAIAAALYKAQLAPGQRTEIEAELSALRSSLLGFETAHK